MKNCLIIGLILISMIAIDGNTFAAILPWNTIVIGKQTESERLATVDLQRYLAQVTGKVPKIVSASAWNNNPCPAVIIGTVSSNSVIKQSGIAVSKLDDQGYYLANGVVNNMQVVIAAGRTPVGATNAVYGLLKELGFGFYLGSEAIPDSIPRKLPKSPVVRNPVFKVRGVLPWYNFLNSPTTWDPIDHRAFVDQLIRCGANYVGFHTYDNEPFAAYEENGQMVWGARLLNTKSSLWGTSPMRNSEFGYGTGKLFAGDYFGAASTFIPDNNTAIKTEQNIMRDALDYAKKRGLKTCLGFEINNDPTNPKERDVFLKRINHLLNQYPSLDYIWIWEPESQGASGITFPGPDSSKLPLYGAARRDTFKRIVNWKSGAPPFYQDTEAGRVARANEGARLEQFGLLAYHQLQHRKNAPKLVISGWGGDERILSAEYYEGLDRLLPKDVIFSSLDHINPRPRVDRIYNELPKDRERWPIPWLECDGDQWHPQPWVHIMEPMLKDAQKGGSQGILGIHWRTRDVAENFQYIIDYAWNPGLSAEDFFKDLAKRCYPAAIAPQMAVIHSELDKLGYRWIGGAGQSECAPFAWGPGEEAKAMELEKLRHQIVSLMPKSGRSITRLRWLMNTISWIHQFHSAELTAVRAQGMLYKARGEDSETAKNTAREALLMLNMGQMARALRAYSWCVTTRGEYGVLATVITKAYSNWRDMRTQLMKIAGDAAPDEPPMKWDPSPQILLPRFVASAEFGKQLVLDPIVLGGGKAWCHYRRLGQNEWTTQPIVIADSWVGAVSIPAESIKTPGLEIAFSLSEDPTQPMRFEPFVVTVMPSITVNTKPFTINNEPKTSKLNVSVKEGKVIPVELSWNDVPGADFYKVYRDGKLAVETGVAFFPDAPTTLEGTYVVEAWHSDKVVVRSIPVRYAIADHPIDEQFTIEFKTNHAGVILRWPATKSPYVTTYKISRIDAGGTGQVIELTRILASRTAEHVYHNAPSPGKWTYSITPMSISSKEGKPATVTADFSPKTDIKPSIVLPLTSKPDGCQIYGEVKFGESGAQIESGYIVMPMQPAMDFGDCMTLKFEFKTDDVQNMPVLLSHGQYLLDGWFVQILGGRLMVRARNSDALGPMVEPGKWYAVKLIYDGVGFQLFIDGKQVDYNPGPVTASPAYRDLTIGQYELKESSFQFHGNIRNIEIYNDAVM
jgi:hypothetical protein